MKQILRTLSLLTPLLFTLASAPDALAYYDPGVQRWINRDPIQEAGGKNLHQFCNNNAVGFLDYFGETTRVGDGRYGDCTKQQHHDLHDAASRACKSSGKLTCKGHDTCETIKEKLAKFDACIAAKSLVNQTCFSEESSIYAREIGELNSGRQNCSDLFCRKRCK